jgi:hypothetical protein
VLKVTHAADWGGFGTRSANEDESVFWRARPPTHNPRPTTHMHMPHARASGGTTVRVGARVVRPSRGR